MPQPALIHRCPPDHGMFVPAVFDALHERAEEFQAAEPFKHLVIDGLFQEAFLRRVADQFYPPQDLRWHRFTDDSRQVKLALQSDYDQPPLVRSLLRELNAEPFLRRLTELTGVGGLIADPYLEGAGMHQILPGGKLGIHADFNKHSIMNVDRRLNVIIYLNEAWEEGYGGHLELWDRGMTGAVQRIAPVFNRLVVFLTDDFSYHGHPDPLTCPPGRMRKSVAMYYYTNGRPESERDQASQHSTLFRERPGEVFAAPRPDRIGEVKRVIKEGLPMPLRRLARRVLGREG